MRQGGILSPIFYCLYIDDLVEILTNTGAGCHLRFVFLSILLYADDMALLAPSLKGLQTLPSAPERYCKKWDVNHVMLNAKKEKSKNMCFGKKQNLCCLHLDGKTIGILRNHSESSHEFPLLHQRESPIILPVCQWHTKDQGSF